MNTVKLRLDIELSLENFDRLRNITGDGDREIANFVGAAIQDRLNGKHRPARVLASINEAAEFLNWSSRKVYREINAGRFPEPLNDTANGKYTNYAWDVEDLLPLKESV